MHLICSTADQKTYSVAPDLDLHCLPAPFHGNCGICLFYTDLYSLYNKRLTVLSSEVYRIMQIIYNISKSKPGCCHFFFRRKVLYLYQLAVCQMDTESHDHVQEGETGNDGKLCDHRSAASVLCLLGNKTLHRILCIQGLSARIKVLIRFN